jgi:hypothetical protein
LSVHMLPSLWMKCLKAAPLNFLYWNDSNFVASDGQTLIRQDARWEEDL